MREIKFRGKSKLGMNPYIKGFLLIDENENRFISFKPDNDNFQLCPVFEESVGQFTGLKDKNGTEIYEGDIAIFFGIVCEIKWNENFCGFTLNGTDKTISYWSIKDCKLIGNIYDNPELL